jgi:hypothetical protein
MIYLVQSPSVQYVSVTLHERLMGIVRLSAVAAALDRPSVGLSAGLSAAARRTRASIDGRLKL